MSNRRMGPFPPSSRDIASGKYRFPQSGPCRLLISHTDSDRERVYGIISCAVMQGLHNAEVTPTYNEASGDIHRGFELRSLPRNLAGLTMKKPDQRLAARPHGAHMKDSAMSLLLLPPESANVRHQSLYIHVRCWNSSLLFPLFPYRSGPH